MFLKDNDPKHISKPVSRIDKAGKIIKLKTSPDFNPFEIYGLCLKSQIYPILTLPVASIFKQNSRIRVKLAREHLTKY